MTTSISEATGAATPITVCKGKPEQKTWLLSPLVDDDYGILENWVRDEYVALVKRNVVDLSEADRRYHTDRAFDQAQLITVDSEVATKRINTPPGVIKILWLSLRHEHPDVTEEIARGLCLNNPEFDKACQDVIRKSGQTAPQKKTRVSTKVQAKRRSRKKR